MCKSMALAVLLLLPALALPERVFGAKPAVGQSEAFSVDLRLHAADERSGVFALDLSAKQNQGRTDRFTLDLRLHDSAFTSRLFPLDLRLADQGGRSSSFALDLRSQVPAPSDLFALDLRLNEHDNLSGVFPFNMLAGMAERVLVLGDVDEDGEISLRDALFVLNIFLGKLIPNSGQLKAADGDGDGKVTPFDALIIFLAFLDRGPLVEGSKYVAAKPVASEPVALIGRFETQGENQARLVLSMPDVPVGALELELHYDPALLRWVERPEEHEPGDRNRLTAVHEIESGKLGLAQIKTADPRPDLGELQFELLVPAAERQAWIEVSSFRVVDEYGRERVTELETRFDLVSLPTVFALHANYPNPFNPETIIRYDLPAHLAEGGVIPVHLQVYNILGQVVRTLVREEQQPGRYALRWDGRDNQGREVSSGVYIYRIVAGDRIQVRRMMVLK